MEMQTLTTLEGMDSREIATLTRKDHAHVCRDIRTMLEDMGEGGESRFGSSYLTGQNKAVTCYILPKRECLILVSGYNVKLRTAIIDRWAELESAQLQPPKPMSRLELARMLLDAEERAASLEGVVESQNLQILRQAPAVAFVDRFVEAKQTQPLRQVAKALKVPERKFVQVLLDHKVLFRLAGKLTPRAGHMEAGRFEVKELVTADGFATTQMRFTPKGVEWIARRVQEWGLT